MKIAIEITCIKIK